MNQPVNKTPTSVNTNTLDMSNGERVRIEHALNRIESIVIAVRIAMREPTAPIGFDATHALVTTALDIATHAAASDMALRLRPSEGL